MPFISKANNRQTGTPSPTPGDFLNTLLIVKDTVNATLLNEHTRLADLSNVLSDVEDQIRAAVELTIKNLKTEYEKRKRKTVPGIKRLQDSIKSLSKSESKCKASERYCKNADAKKAKRRIKDAKKTLQEFTSSDIDFGVSTFVADQITLLCQQVMQIPPKLSSKDTKEESADVQQEKSDSDSEGSSRVNTPTSHIYTEIDVFQARNSTYLTPRRSTYIFPSERDSKTDTSDKGSPVQRLNSVVLFSSDSEDDYGFSNTKKKADTKRPISAGGGNRKSRSGKKPSKSKSESPDYEILNKPTRNDLFRRSSSTGKSPSRSRQSSLVRSPSPVVYDDYEKPVKGETESLSAPIKEYIKRMSPSGEVENPCQHTEVDNLGEHIPYVKNKKTAANVFAHTFEDESLPSASRTIHKRLLPATPRHKVEGKNKEITCLRSQHTNCQSNFQLNTDQTDGGLLDDTDGALLEDTDQTDGALLEDTDQADGGLLGDTTDSLSLSTANNTVELLKAAQDLLRKSNFTEMSEHKEYELEKVAFGNIPDSNEVKAQPSPLENDYIDIEEIKFRESVRSARREIIDKLKSKYAYNCNNSAVLDNGNGNTSCTTRISNESLNNQDSNSTKVLKDYKYKHIFERDSRNFLSGRGNDISTTVRADKNHSTSLINENVDETLCNSHINNSKGHYSGVYKSKLIYTYDTENKTNHVTPSKSIVTSAIKMFENASVKGEQTNSRGKKQKPVVKHGLGARYRSVSEPRTTVSTLDNSKTYMPGKAQSNKALLPRMDIQTQRSVERDNSELSEGESSNCSKSCTENDLLNLVRNESSSSIRKQWRKRRSASMTPRITDASRISGTAYEYWCSFSIPKQTTRCFISAIVVLDDRSIVLLDELHSYLHLFDRTFKHKDQYRLLDIPRGCVQVDSDTVAVAFPYKKCICTYCIKIGAILSGNETTVPCREWVVDIAFSKSLFYVLCKAGEIHVLTENGSENNCIRVGISGILFIPPSGKRMFILGEGRVSKFGTDGTFISSKADMDAHSMIFLENRIYVADRQRHKVVPLSDSADGQNLVNMKIEYPTAVSSSINGDTVLISQFEESMDLALTSTIHVLKLKRK